MVSKAMRVKKIFFDTHFRMSTWILQWEVKTAIPRCQIGPVIIMQNVNSQFCFCLFFLFPIYFSLSSAYFLFFWVIFQLGVLFIHHQLVSIQNRFDLGGFLWSLCNVMIGNHFYLISDFTYSFFYSLYYISWTEVHIHILVRGICAPSYRLNAPRWLN